MKLARKTVKQPDSDYPAEFSATLPGDSIVRVVIDKTPRGIVVHAEETIDGAVVGRIDASHGALQRALGMSQRMHQGGS